MMQIDREEGKRKKMNGMRGEKKEEKRRIMQIGK